MGGWLSTEVAMKKLENEEAEKRRQHEDRERERQHKERMQQRELEDRAREREAQRQILARECEEKEKQRQHDKLIEELHSRNLELRIRRLIGFSPSKNPLAQLVVDRPCFPRTVARDNSEGSEDDDDDLEG